LCQSTLSRGNIQQVPNAVAVRLQGGVVGLRRSLKQCDCRLALPKSGVQIRVSRPDLVRNLVTLEVRPRFCRVNVCLRLGHAVFARASIKDSPLKIESQFPDQISSVRPGIWGLEAVEGWDGRGYIQG
jgi:hypothetical protein